MTIQFNLLPDIKIEYLKARRQQHLVVLASVLASIVMITVLALLLSIVYGLQKKNLNDLNADIKSASNELRSTKDLTKILTVQNQLKVLPGLHDKKVVSSRMYEYLSQVTPTGASIAKLDVDFTLNTMVVSGSAADLATVNKYADTLKFTKFSTKAQSTEKNAFVDIVLDSFAVDSENGVTYSLSLKFDPVIFDGTQTVELTVPQIISTRSEVDKPAALFQDSEEQ
jgi:Tfp pilus assembly protein PilN